MTSASKDEPYVRYAATFAGYHSVFIPFLYLVLILFFSFFILDFLLMAWFSRLGFNCLVIIVLSRA